MDKPKGGRGHTAPYETKQMRVPTGLEPQIQELIARYRDWISDAGTGIAGADNPPKLLDKTEDKLVDKLLEDNKTLHKLVDKLQEENTKLVDRLKEGTAKPIDRLQQDELKPVDRLIKVSAETVSGNDNKIVNKLREQNPSTGLTGRELARRLGANESSVRSNRTKGNFATWSKERDPDAISWNYENKSKKYFPVIL